MGIALDVEEIMAGGCLDAVKRVLVTASTLFIGCFIGSLSLVIAAVLILLFDGHFKDAFELYLNGLLLSSWAFLWGFLSFYGLLMAVLLLGTALYFTRSEGGTLRNWLIITTAFAVFVALGFHQESGAPLWLIGITFLIQIAMLSGGAIFLTAWNRNRFAQHLVELQAESQARRLELQALYAPRKKPPKESSNVNKPPPIHVPKA